jgi:hypothetical protein
MRTFLTLILATSLAGCAGLDTMRFETKGLTPNAARVLNETVVGAHKSLCKDGVRSEQRTARVEAPLPQNPREYPPIFQPAPRAETKAELKCN